jgi:cardiolipin synthase A/B
LTKNRISAYKQSKETLGGGVISQKSLDSVTLIMLMLLFLLIPVGLIELFFGRALISNLSHYMLHTVDILFSVTIILIIIVLVLENDDPVHTLAWILVLLYIPLLGFVFYLFFGRNWRKSRLFSRKGLKDEIQLDQIITHFSLDNTDSKLSDLQQKLCNLLANNDKAILTDDNTVEIISDTNAVLDKICTSIQNARKHVHLEYFSISKDDSGLRIKDLLIRKAREGVEVRFIYDDVGCWNLGHRFKTEMRAAGVQFIPFMPVWLPFINSKLNYRNHRKLVIIDGETGFLGGPNIADKYFGKTKNFGYWRDTSVGLRGESVTALQAAFLTDWYFVSKQNLLKPENFVKYAPLLSNTEATQTGIPVQIASSGPDTDHASILQVFFAAISNARHSIRITSPYLILNSSLLMALKTAAFSGVKVQIILPARLDHFIVFWGSKSYYRELLETGIEIFEYQPGFMHAKVLVVDDEVLSIGTVNMDLRSFNQNFEITAMVYDVFSARQAAIQFDADREQSRKIELDEWIKRFVLKKALESVCRLFSPLL